jgi:uncharacterized protein
MHVHIRSLLTITLAAAAVLPLAARADDATRKAKAEEMLQLTQAAPAMQKQLQALEERVQQLASQQAPAAGQNAEQKKITDDYLKQVQTTMDEEIGWPKLHSTIVQSYADTFTEEQLDGIIAFYKSPAGKAVLEKTPELVGKTNELVTSRIKEMQPKLAAMTEAYTTKLKAAGPAPAATPAAKPAAPSLKPNPAAPSATH